ncbi:MAG: hypothetical protein JWN60_1038 [Acidobacteria bacterium]|jgi:hypothetical protein|nr:hypothetical protein [Acidobacteriota bacterium]
MNNVTNNEKKNIFHFSLFTFHFIVSLFQRKFAVEIKCLKLQMFQFVTKLAKL